MPKIVKSLTETQCRNARYVKDGKNLLFDGGGLYLELMPSGTKSWRLKYQRPNGASNRISFGPYPEISLLRARELREETKNKLREGKDPAIQRAQKKQEAFLNAHSTFQDLANEWYELNRSKWVERHAQNTRSRIDNDLIKPIGHMPMVEITPMLMLSTIRKIENRGAFDIARRTKQIAGQIFSYAIVTGRAQINPCANLNVALKPYTKGHFAAIEPKEIPTFLKALHGPDSRCHKMTRLATMMLMLTFVRTSELIKSTWPEFDLEKGEWLISSERMKMRRDHIVPLSTQALAILKELKLLTGKNEYVFPHASRSKKHMSEATVLNAIKRIGYKGKMTGHGFRALAMTTLKEELGFPHEVIDRQLAHAPSSKLGRAYDRTEFLKERRVMMQAWADYLDEMKK